MFDIPNVYHWDFGPTTVIIPMERANKGSRAAANDLKVVRLKVNGTGVRLKIIRALLVAASKH
jgi:hypothetical protein